jgi:hypothetical protein
VGGDLGVGLWRVPITRQVHLPGEGADASPIGATHQRNDSRHGDACRVDDDFLAAPDPLDDARQVRLGIVQLLVHNLRRHGSAFCSVTASPPEGVHVLMRRSPMRFITAGAGSVSLCHGTSAAEVLVPDRVPSVCTPISAGQVVQSCQLKPATRPNSPVLAVTTVSPRRRAWPAISRS